MRDDRQAVLRSTVPDLVIGRTWSDNTAVTNDNALTGKVSFGNTHSQRRIGGLVGSKSRI